MKRIEPTAILKGGFSGILKNLIRGAFKIRSGYLPNTDRPRVSLT